LRVQTHASPEVDRLNARFAALQAEVDGAFGKVARFECNDRSEVYKAILKAAITLDGELVGRATRLALENFPEGGLAQVYPMLHLPQDLSERGNWHRDDNTPDRRVFWIPVSSYGYPALSVVPHSDGLLSMPLSLVGSRGVPLVGLQRALTIAPGTFYSWSSRFVHRGNLNTSDRVGAALVIFLDRGKPSREVVTAPLSLDALRAWSAALRQAISFDHAGHVDAVDGARLDGVAPKFLEHVGAFFKLRAKRELLVPARPAGVAAVH
jgi:hypothetical protein